ncbi:MAG TPA: thiamine-phosphate kinase [Chryseosolibacter sp.]|nr:thiamine-phosphate kinase [Chryseosolibacter sp.]
MSEKRNEIKDLGEFGLIDRIAADFAVQNPTSIKGIGDDAAVVHGGTDRMLISTDMLVEGIHFDLAFTPLHHLGYKAVAVNVSDIAAMNGRAEQITVSIGLSNRFSLEAVDALYQGIKAACQSYNVDLIGGDTTASYSGLIISVTVIGRANEEMIAYRNGAQPNDIVCVTGDLGAAFLGLKILQREKEVFEADPQMQPDLEKYEYMVGRQLKPEARADIVFDLAEHRVKPTSMIDISDGLASEILHLSKQSKVGIRIYEDKLPIDSFAYETAVEFKIDPVTCALNGGEDYELLFTISKDDQEKLKNHPDIHMIGYVHERADENVMITKQGTVVPLRAQGWDHLKK